MYKRNVPAMDANTTPPLWDLTNAQWMVYYWLLANSKRNPNPSETHYYIYRNSFTLTQIRKATGIKSDNTIRTAFKKLCEVGAMENSQDNRAYLLTRPRLYVPMSASIIRALLAFNSHIDAGTTITAFAILCRLVRFSDTPSSFTKAEFAGLMRCARQNTDEMGVVLILHLLKGLELIDFFTTPYTNRFGRQCIRYTLTAANPASNTLNSIVEEDDAPTSIESLWATIMSKPLED